MAFLELACVQNAVKLFNSGFIFADGFRDCKQYKRYCGKIADGISAFVAAAVDDGTGRGLSLPFHEMILSFFKFWASDSGNGPAVIKFMVRDDKGVTECMSVGGSPDDMPREDIADWRNNLYPLTMCEPHSFARTDPLIKNGWLTMFEEPDNFKRILFDPCFDDACFIYLHSRMIDGGISRPIVRDNFVRDAQPDSLAEAMRFTRILLNTIWTSAYAMFVWAQQDRADDFFESQKLSREISDLILNKENLEQNLDKANSEIEDLKSKLSAVGSEIEARAKMLAEEKKARLETDMAALRKEMRELSRENEELRAKNADLREKIEISDAVAADIMNNIQARAQNPEDPDNIQDQNQNMGRVRTRLDYNSKILFIASRADNGSVKGTYDRVLAKFPNSRFVHDAKDISTGFDCYVMLTKYMFNHGLYWAVRDCLAARGLPYLYSENQNADRIAQDIFNRSRYTDT